MDGFCTRFYLLFLWLTNIVPVIENGIAGKFTYEDESFLLIQGDNQRCRSVNTGEPHQWIGRCDIFFTCSSVGDPQLNNYNAYVYKCEAGRSVFRKPKMASNMLSFFPCTAFAQKNPCINAEPAKFLEVAEPPKPVVAAPPKPVVVEPPKPVVAKPVFLVEDDIVPSKGKLTWKDAYDRCVKSGLVLATVENKEDNEFLLNNQRLKRKPYNDNTKFWTAGKMAGSDFDDSKLYWEPSGKTFPNHNTFNSNGVSKKWDEFPIPKPDKGITCVSIRFPGTTISYWSISDCNQRNYYICMREMKNRGSRTPAKIEGDEEGGIPLTNNDVAFSKGKLSWQDAFDRCRDSGLVLGSVENEDDNIYLSSNQRLHSKPYDQATRFWTCGKMKGARFEDAKLFWESSGKLFPNHMTAKANGVNKLWDEPPNPKPKQGIMCLDINFPTNSASLWTISDCNEKRYYICMRLPEERGDSNSRQPTINNDIGNGGEDEPEYAMPKPKTKPRPNSPPTPMVSPPVTGTFIPDATLKKLIRGTLKKGKPSVFTPDNVDETLRGITPGIFIPDESMSEEWPYSALHGSLKPYAAVPGSSIFVPDSFVSGQFKPDSGSRVYPGSLTQENPSIFTPDSAPYITKPMYGTWRPNVGALPNHPCQNVHGNMVPVPGSETEVQFTPDPTQQGSFLPDANPKKQIGGSLSQNIPPEFTPTVPSQLIQRPTSGTWRPKQGDSKSPSHGIMKPSAAGDTNIFVPDEVIMGQFVPDESSINPIEGYITVSLPRVFNTPDETADLSQPVAGTWKPKPGQRGAGKPQGVHGVLKPDSNVLPPYFSFFNPGTFAAPAYPQETAAPAYPQETAAPAYPQGTDDFVEDETEAEAEDCDPELERLGTKSKFFVSCKKG